MCMGLAGSVQHVNSLEIGEQHWTHFPCVERAVVRQQVENAPVPLLVVLDDCLGTRRRVIDRIAMAGPGADLISRSNPRECP
jgi:hypothetical protein